MHTHKEWWLREMHVIHHDGNNTLRCSIDDPTCGSDLTLREYMHVCVRQAGMYVCMYVCMISEDEPPVAQSCHVVSNYCMYCAY
jgi:hypothetical protein